MFVHTFAYDLDSKAWSIPKLPPEDSPRTLVLAFAAPEALTDTTCFATLARTYPRSVIIGCSSAGEIHGTTIRDRSVSVTTTRFEKTDLVLVSMDVANAGESFGTGQALAKNLSAKPNLRAVLVLSEGLNVNGSELVRGLNAALGPNVVVTGGLSGDGTRFKQTWVAVGAKVKSNLVAAVGFYGDHVQVGHGSKGGWDKFGPERVVTRSEGNVLYELDGKPALALYKEYLGEKAKDLPASGLLFPLSLRASTKDDKALVRTLLAVDHEKNSLTFAGDIPKGYQAQLMKADFDRLIGGASLATAMVKETGSPVGKDSLVVAISCVGRRLVLGERTEEEVEAVLDAMPKEQKAHITGFYSYGELSPYASGSCDLHNQTMTLTVFSESATPLARTASAARMAATEAFDDDTAKIAAARSAPKAAAKLPPSRPPPGRRSPLDDSDAEPVNTKMLSTSARGFAVEAFGFDLAAKRWSTPKLPELDSPRTLVLAFGAPEVLEDPEPFAELARAYPRSIVLGCSSAGEIHGAAIRDKSIAVTATRFEKTDLALASMEVVGPADSFTTGEQLAKKLAAKPKLRAVLVLSEGLNVNGSELVRGINGAVGAGVVVTGGLSGDGTRFKQTWVAIGAKVRSNVVAAVGFYGDHVQVGHGSKGGWDKFGPERVVTRSEGNVLYELDGKPALALYKEYLGEKAKDLPASGLLFPLSLRASTKDDKALVRTLLAVDHEKNSLTFAGDIPKGYQAQLMKADFDRLIGGASLATAMVKETGSPVGKDSLVVAISCVGRRLVLGERTEEEVEAVLDAMPKEQKAHITGFYSYGELSPYASGSCDLHNQTMTLTVFSESATPLARTAPPPAVPKAAPPPPPPPPVASLRATSSWRPQRTGPVTRMTASGSSATGAQLHKRTQGDVTIVTITGRLTESFKGESVGRELRGTVVFDLGGVDRITSFGVREWLSMLGAMQDTRRMFIVRASEATANQLSMIRKFSGSAQIVSFFAPYLCSGCGDAFERLFECERDAELVREGSTPDTPCPACGAVGHFDDDARSYFAFAMPHLAAAVPEEIRAIALELDAASEGTAREAVDKTFEGEVTRVRVQSKVGGAIRWKRVFEGIEGPLAIDLGGVSGFDQTGVANLEQALGALGSEVTTTTIERCPAPLVERFSLHGLPPRVAISSMLLDARCPACAVARSAHVSLHEHGDALGSGLPPRVNCKRCNGELVLDNASGAAARALALLRTQVTPRHGAPYPSSPMSMPPSSTGTRPSPGLLASLPPPEPPATSLGGMAVGGQTARSMSPPADAPTAPRARRSPALYAITGLSLAVAALAAMQLVRATAPAPAPGALAPASASAAPAAGWMQTVDLPPAWVERPFVIEGADVFVVGKSESTASAEAAMASARNDGLVRLVRQVNQELVGSAVGEFLQARVRESDRAASEAIASRYIRQFGATASPERVDAAVRRRESGMDGFARYRLSKNAYQQLVAAYRETSNIQGMTVARFFPLLETTLHTEGDLVVLSVARGRPAAEVGVRPGDIVLAVGGRPVATTEAFAKAGTDEWAATPPRGRMSVDLESAGAKRQVFFFKPAPPPNGAQ